MVHRVRIALVSTPMASVHKAVIVLDTTKTASVCLTLSVRATIVKMVSNAKAAIVRKARNTEAVDAVQNQGFYTAAEIIEEGDKFVCKYTLIYAKGDHISKVEGVHALA